MFIFHYNTHIYIYIMPQQILPIQPEDVKVNRKVQKVVKF